MLCIFAVRRMLHVCFCVFVSVSLCVLCMLRCQWRSFKLHVNHFILNGLWFNIYYLQFCAERSSICRGDRLYVSVKKQSSMEFWVCGNLVFPFLLIGMLLAHLYHLTFFQFSCVYRFLNVNHFDFHLASLQWWNLFRFNLGPIVLRLRECAVFIHSTKWKIKASNR